MFFCYKITHVIDEPTQRRKSLPLLLRCSPTNQYLPRHRSFSMLMPFVNSRDNQNEDFEKQHLSIRSWRGLPISHLNSNPLASVKHSSWHQVEVGWPSYHNTKLNYPSFNVTVDDFYPDYQQPSQSTKESWMESSSNSTLHQVVAKSSSIYSALSNEFSCNSTMDDVPLDLAMDNMCLIKKKKCDTLIIL